MMDHEVSQRARCAPSWRQRRLPPNEVVHLPSGPAEQSCRPGRFASSSTRPAPPHQRDVRQAHALAGVPPARHRETPPTPRAELRPPPVHLARNGVLRIAAAVPSEECRCPPRLSGALEQHGQPLEHASLPVRRLWVSTTRCRSRSPSGVSSAAPAAPDASASCRARSRTTATGIGFRILLSRCADWCLYRRMHRRCCSPALTATSRSASLRRRRRRLVYARRARFGGAPKSRQLGQHRQILQTRAYAQRQLAGGIHDDMVRMEQPHRRDWRRNTTAR